MNVGFRAGSVPRVHVSWRPYLLQHVLCLPFYSTFNLISRISASLGRRNVRGISRHLSFAIQGSTCQQSPPPSQCGRLCNASSLATASIFFPCILRFILHFSCTLLVRLVALYIKTKRFGFLWLKDYTCGGRVLN